MIIRTLVAAAVLGIAACASEERASAPVTPVDGVSKVVESLSGEIERRLQSEPFSGRAVIVDPLTPQRGGIEPMLAELLRTRLVEKGVAVERACAARCMEVTLHELVIDSPRDSGLTPGQLVTVVGGYIPVIGGLVRSLGEREEARRRAANRATGVLVTLAARDGDRYVARHSIVAITAAGDVALEGR